MMLQSGSISTVTQAWNLAMFGNNRLFAFCISSRGIDDIWPGWESSRKMRVLAHFTIHVVEIIQLYTDQPYMWLEHGHHPSSSVFQPHVWLDTISNSWNNTK